MAFIKKEKNFINKNYLEMSVKDMAKILKTSEKEISQYLIKNNFIDKKTNPALNEKSSIFQDFEFKSIKDVFFDNFYFWLGIAVLIIVLFYRSYDSILLSDEMTMFNDFASGKWVWWKLLYGSMVNQYLAFAFFGINPFGYRVIATGFHLVNIFLFFYLFRNFISEKILKIAILLISVHSIFVEPLTWVAANPYVYHGFVYLLIMIFSFKYEKTNKIYFLILYYALVINFTLQGGHTNFAPLFAIVFNLFILKRSFKKELILSGWLLLMIPVFTMLNKKDVDARVASLTTGPYFEKFVQTLPFTVAKSMELVFFPFSLALFHEETLTPGYYNFARILTLGFIFIVIYLFFKKKTYFGIVAIACAFCIYIFSPVQIAWFVAERYMYLTTFFVCLLLAIFFNYLNKKVPNLGNLLIACYFFFFLFTTFNRFNAWASAETLWEENIKIAPDSYRVRNNLADTYSKNGKFELATKQFSEALRINPNFVDAYFNLANSYLAQNKFSEAEAYLLKSVQMNPALVESYLKLGLIKANTGNFKEAYYYIDKALEIEPNLEIAKNLKQQIKDYEIKQKN
jgi:hypothetical protein